MIPKDAAARGRAFPTPRTWDYAARLSAFARAVGAPKAVRRLLVAGCMGEAVAHEYLAWVGAQDLADPEELLADADGLRLRRAYGPTGSYVTAPGVLGAVAGDATGPLGRRGPAVRQAADAAGSTRPSRSSGR